MMGEMILRVRERESEEIISRGHSSMDKYNTEQSDIFHLVGNSKHHSSANGKYKYNVGDGISSFCYPAATAATPPHPYPTPSPISFGRISVLCPVNEKEKKKSDNHDVQYKDMDFGSNWKHGD